MNPTFPLNLPNIRFRRGLVFGILIIGALVAFEMFNYSTTEFALKDLLGDLRFLGVRWATILSIAFCGIDFAGIARLFTPEQGADEPAEVWYLFGAWLLAATMNAMLTWWGVSIAILNHETMGSAVVARETMIKVVPVFVAIMVWLIRILIIGTFSVAGERMFSQSERRRSPRVSGILPAASRPVTAVRPMTQPAAATYRPAPKTGVQSAHSYSRPEPTYHPTSLSGSNPKSNSNFPR